MQITFLVILNKQITQFFLIQPEFETGGGRLIIFWGDKTAQIHWSRLTQELHVNSCFTSEF